MRSVSSYRVLNLQDFLAHADPDDPRVEAVRRVMESESFAKSPTLKKFLLYMADRALNHPQEPVNEQIIGVEVFRRKPGYDSNDDNIVRATATRLRQKLEAHYQGLGVSDPLQLSLPRGGYVLLFGEVAEAAAAFEEPEPESPERVEPATFVDSVPSATGRRWILPAAMALVVLLGAVWGILWAVRPKPGTNAVLWKSILTGDRPTYVVPGDSSLVLYNNFTGKTLSLADYLSGQFRSDSVPAEGISESLLHLIAKRRLTTIVDLEVVEQIVRRPEAGAGDVRLRYARDMNMDDVKHGNVILIGSEEANPWVQLFKDNVNFEITPDQVSRKFTVRNRNPKQGEQPIYRSELLEASRRAYALITLLPKTSGDGRVLILQGSAMAGTQAAAEFALNDPEMGRLLSSEGGKRLESLEVLLETSAIQGAASPPKIVGWRLNGK